MLTGFATRVLPVTTVCAEATEQENRKFPAVTASQNDRWVITDGDANAHDAHVGVFDAVFDPPAAAFQVTATRGTEAMVFAVPAEPGSPVWGRTKDPAGAVNAVPAIMSSHLLSRLTALRPAVTAGRHMRAWPRSLAARLRLCNHGTLRRPAQ